MSDERRVLLIGASGLVGRAVIAASAEREDIHLLALARREIPLPTGARIEVLVAETDRWAEAIAGAQAEVVVIALGTTIKAVGGDKAAFRAVDHDLVVRCAEAAKAAGAHQVIVISSFGASLSSRNFYLSVKGKMEDRLAGLHFGRLDVLRPGLLRGRREGVIRPAERIGMVLSPLVDRLLIGRMARYRSIRAADLARVILALAGARPAGRFVHHHREFRRLLAR